MLLNSDAKTRVVSINYSEIALKVWQNQKVFYTQSCEIYYLRWKRKYANIQIRNINIIWVFSYVRVEDKMRSWGKIILILLNFLFYWILCLRNTLTTLVLSSKHVLPSISKHWIGSRYYLYKNHIQIKRCWGHTFSFSNMLSVETVCLL